MTDFDDVSDEYRAQLREAVEEAATAATDFEAFHSRLNRAAGAALDELGRRSRGGGAVAAASAAWWDYAARAALAAVPLGLAAALVLITFLRSGSGSVAAEATPAVAASAGAAESSDSARAAFESVLTGVAAPRAVMSALIPVPAAAFLADTPGGKTK